MTQNMIQNLHLITALFFLFITWHFFLSKDLKEEMKRWEKYIFDKLFGE